MEEGEMMVQPIDRERGKQFIRTIEQRLADKFDDLQVVREQKATEGAGIIFDELSKSIIILLKSNPDAYNELVALKKEADADFIKAEQEINYRADQQGDAIKQQMLINMDLDQLRWDYREYIEELFMEVMQKYQLIEMKRPVQATIISQELNDDIQSISPTEIQPRQSNVGVVKEEVVQQQEPEKKKISFRKS